MRQLVLLRHAHAEPAVAGQADFDRPLSPEGVAEAEAGGVWLEQHGFRPDLVVYSPSRRTHETLERVLAVLGNVEAMPEPRIYDATPGTLMAIADAHKDGGRVLLVGHNPGMEQLLALLASGQSGEFRGMPAGGVAVLDLPPDAGLEPGIGTLSAFWWP